MPRICSPQLDETPTATWPSIAAQASHNLCKWLLGRCPVFCATVAPPEEGGDQQYRNRDAKIKALDLAFQPIPMPAEEISHAGDDAYPQSRPHEIEDKESLPWHAENARQ